MARLIHSVRVIGLGKVGELVATLLADAGFDVTACDARARTGLPFATAALDVRDAAALADALTGADAVVSCLPYNLNLPVAEAAHAAGVHYFDLTEDVPTTNRVLRAGRQGRRHRPGAAVRPGPRPDRHHRRLADPAVPEHPRDRAEGRRAAAAPGRPARLRVQLVGRGRRQRVPQRLRGAAQRRAPDGAGDDRARAGRHRRHRARGVADLGRPGHDVRDVLGPGAASGLQDDALPRPLRADAVLLRRARHARTSANWPARSWSTPSRRSTTTWSTCTPRSRASPTASATPRRAS